MSNLDRDLAEMQRLGYGTNYGRYKLDFPDTNVKTNPAKTLGPEDYEEIPEVLHDLACSFCGESFKSTRMKKYCSVTCCKAAAKRRRNQRVQEAAQFVTVRCAECGAQFHKSRQFLKYCSKECRTKAQRRYCREWDARYRGL